MLDRNRYGGLDAPDDDVAGQALAAAERRWTLERLGRDAAEIHIDLADHGALGQIVAELRLDALAAYEMWPESDPCDSHAQVRMQAVVQGYKRCWLKVVQKYEAANQAAQIITEEYGTDNEQDPYTD